MNAAQLKEAIAKAKGAAPSAHASGSAGPRGAGSSEGHVGEDLLTTLLRDHLYLRQDMRPVADAAQLAVIFKTDETANAFKLIVQSWVDSLPGNKGTKRKENAEQDESGMDQDSGAAASTAKGASKGKQKKEPNPLGPRKPFLIFAFFDMLGSLAWDATPGADSGLTEEKKKEAVEACKVLTSLGAAEIDLSFSGFSAKYPKPMQGRPWLWVLTLNSFISPEVRAALVKLIGATNEFVVRMDLKRSFQGKPEEVLWDKLKTRRRK